MTENFKLIIHFHMVIICPVSASLRLHIPQMRTPSGTQMGPGAYDIQTRDNLLSRKE